MDRYQRWLVLPAIVLAAFLTLASGPAAADQNDSRLDGLFARLLMVRDFRAAQGIELSIWGIWIESNDPAVEILMEQGLTAMARRDMRAALGKFDQMVKILPAFAEGWNKRATVYYLLGNFSGSLHDIERTLNLEPRHFGALSGLGLISLAIGEEERALEAFEAALSIHPRMPGTMSHIRELREKLHGRVI